MDNLKKIERPEVFGKDPPLVDLNEFPSWIIYEDENFLAVNKPGWLVCHPSKNGDLSSLVGAARQYLKAEVLHIVNRLDRETSGVVLLVKNSALAGKAQKSLDASKGKCVQKKYLALLRGHIRGEITISQALADDENSKVAIKTRCLSGDPKAKNAVTIFKPLAHSKSQNFEPASLVEVEILTGRKHQIRAHAQWLGNPIVADKIYGDDETLYLQFIEKGFTDEMAKILPMKRQALHAHSMDFSRVFENLVLTAPLPDDFKTFMRSREFPQMPSLDF